MKKNKLLLIGTIVLAMALIGCPNDQTAGQIIVSDNTNKDQSDDKTSTTIIPTVSTTIPNGNSMKITSLRVAIEMSDYGDVIDFTAEKYNEITDFSNVNINKALTITNFGNMKSETITVSADGVWLNNIGSVSITTNSSLKISGSSLASLNIINVETSSANESGRGGTSAAFAGRSSDKAPTVEVSDTIVSDEVTLGIAGAYLSVDKLDAADAILNLDAANTKLAIADRQTNIKEIKTDKICQVILEDGTSDNIPTPNVSGEGELKQIDMKAAGTLKLLALTPMSGLTTVVKKGEAIDFGNVIVLGTYQADDGVTVFKANGLSYNLTETFSKLEKEFTISIGTDEVYKNGENVSAFDWTALDAGEHSAKIDCECSKDDSYKAYEFSITVTEEAELPTPTLTAIEVYLGANIGTTYLAGDTLDLGTMLVMGVYKAGSITYKNILTDYMLSRQTGTILTTADTAVTVSIPGEDVTGTINLTVKPSVFVTFQVAEGQTIVSRIEQNTEVTAPLNISRIGYTFDSWYDDAACTSEHDFSTTVSQSTTLYAKWYPNAPHIITYHYQNGAADATVDFYEYADVTLAAPTRIGYTFAGWFENEECSGEATTGWRMGERTKDVELWAKWNIDIYIIAYQNDKGVANTNDTTYDIEHSVTLSPLSKTGYIFDGWFKVTGNTTADTSTDKWNETKKQIGDVTFKAGWTPITYTITYQNGKEGVDNTNDTTYDITRSVTLKPLTKTGWRFDGWFKVNGDTTADTSTDIWNKEREQTGDVTFRAGWTPVWYKDSESGNFAYGDTIYSKTGMKQVLDASTDITCDRASGVFPTTRNSVTLGKYAIGKYEVTQELYAAVMESNPSYFTVTQASLGDGETSALLRPVENVSWYDAVVFCNKLSLLMGKTRCYKLKDGTYPDEAQSIPTSNDDSWDNMTCDWTANGYRLPTECEWECAARGGTYSADTPWTYTYSGSNTTDDVAWYTSNSSSHTWEVGLKAANDIGLYDMSGNVWEWCWDNYDNAEITADTLVTGPATNDSSSFYRRRRGGSMDGIASYCSVSHRSNISPYCRNYGFGFRLAQSVTTD